MQIKYLKYVEALATQATEIFVEMTGTEVLTHKVKLDERNGETIPLAHVISYEHIDQPVKGEFILGFANNSMAISVASALADKMGLAPVNELDEIAIDLLNEFMNTIVGRTISDWDRMGLPVQFSPPSALKFSQFTPDENLSTQTYVVILNLTFSHVIFRVTFKEENKLNCENKRILVAEDSAVIRNVIARTLQQYQFSVEQAENGRLAVNLYDSFKPELVIMDLIMPEMGGLEAMEIIRKKDPQAKFVVLTSSSRRDQVLHARKLGVTSYLIKPFNPEMLMKHVMRCFAPKQPIVARRTGQSGARDKP